MEKQSLNARLEDLSKKLENARKILKEKETWCDGHRLTVGELEARYRYLRSELKGQIKDLEAHGHHVSKLESSVWQWFDSLNLDLKR